ncbi:MAG TPA: hypothetical protein VFC47_11140 [Caulobacteraceae bacterium]|nr:hypothetical protein [Caulobacteraceae bacterium]
MPIPATVGAFAIVPSNDLPAAVPFWERLGFARIGGEATYIIMTGWDCEVHLTQAGAGSRAVPEAHNPFGVFVRTPDGRHRRASGRPDHPPGRRSATPRVGPL